MQKLLNFLKSNWFFVGLLLVIVLGTTHPEVGLALKPGLNFMISVSMFLIGFRFETGQLRFSVEYGKALALCLLASFLVMPLLSYALGALMFPGDIDMFVGVMLAGCVPTTQASSVIWTDLSGGNQALSLLLMTVVNLTGIFISPLLLSLGLGSTVAVPVWPMLRTLLFFILFPVFVGRVARRGVPVLPSWVRSASRVLSIVLIWATVLTALSSGNLFEVPLLKVICAVFLQYVSMAGLSYAASRGVGLSRADAIAVMYCSAQVTITFAAVVGFTFFEARSILYVVVYHLFQQFMGQVTAKLIKRAAPSPQ